VNRPAGEHGHGWARRGDRLAAAGVATAIRLRRPTGTPLLVFAVLAVLTFVGLARVHMRSRVLELGETIAELTEERNALLERKRRLQTERAYLRHPDRIGSHARAELGMSPVAPERIQRIRLLPVDGEERP
jgi:cell division protein FtsL